METKFRNFFCSPMPEPKEKPGPRCIDYKAKRKARVHRKFVKWQKRHAA